MEVNDIKVVLDLAKVAHEQTTTDEPFEHDDMGRSITAVETWLTEIGALPPR